MLGWSTCLEVLARCLRTASQRTLSEKLEKLDKQQKAGILEEENAKMKTHVADFAKEVAAKSEEIRRLNNESKEGLDYIWNYI